MRICRTIEGKKYFFELSYAELHNAYLEQQFFFDKADIADQILGTSDDDVVQCYGIPRSEFNDLIDDMAAELRRNIDKYDMSWEYARDEAVRTVIARQKKSEAAVWS